MANAITLIRIFCAVPLIIFPPFSKWFFVFYLLGGVSDILDGFVARHFHQETKFGAKLDTFADFIFITVVLVKIFISLTIPSWLIFWTVCIAVVKFGNFACGFVLYKHFVAEHSAINKICGLLLFILPLCIGTFVWQAVEMLMITICIIATFAAVEEWHFVIMGKEIC